MSKIGYLVSITILLCVLCFFVIFFLNMLPSSAKKSLPHTASEIQEYYYCAGNGDFVRCIKAKLPESDVYKFAQNLDLKMQYNPTVYFDYKNVLNMGFSDSPSWWLAVPVNKSTFFNYTQGDDYLAVLNYSKGYVYYMVTTW